MTVVHSPSCLLGHIAHSLDEAACELSEALEAIQGRASDDTLDETYRILASLELVTGALERLVDDIDSDDACGSEATETHGGAN